MKRFVPFKYKLGIVLFIVVGIVSGTLGINMYFYMKKTLEDRFFDSMDLITDRITSSVNDADHMLLIIEKQMEQEAEKILTKVKGRYEETGTIEFDLSEFLIETPYVDLYIIDRNNRIVKTTDEKELGLDFNAHPAFANYLRSMRLQGGFFPDRVNQSVIDNEMKKFCYMVSDDGNYIFETGCTLERENNMLIVGSGFDNFEHKIIQDNSHLLEKIVMYDYTGTSYKKDEAGNPYTLNEDALPFYLTAKETMTMVERLIEENGRSLYYQYIPYAIAAFQGVNDVNVIEVVYHDTLLREDLRKNLQYIVLSVLIGAVFSASIGMFFARKLYAPISHLTNATSQMASGNFDVQIQIDSNDELMLLGQQFQRMSESIRNFLEERAQQTQELEKKNMEILRQKEEITALFEETHAMNEELESMLEENRRHYFQTVRALANSVEIKDSYTGGHCERVMEYSIRIAEEMGIYPHEIHHLKFGSILHDIGKIGIPETVLNKEGHFAEEEYELMKKHPQFGAKILEDIPFLERSRSIVLQHHERIDGKGYPQGLKGEEIDILARIVCVADAYDAMTSERAYRKKLPLTKEEAIEELRMNSGTQFDEQVVEAFIKSLQTQQNGGT